MHSISHMPSPRSFSNSCHLASTSLLSILPEYLSNFGGVSRHLLKTEEEFAFKILPVLSKFRGCSLMLSSRIIPFVRYSFSYPSGVCQKLFSHFVSPEAIILVIVLYFSRRFVQVLFNQLVISSFFCI